MVHSSTRHSPGRSRFLQTLMGSRRLGPIGAGLLERPWPIQPRLEELENRTLPSVQVLQNFAGINQGGPPDSQMAAGPNNVLEAVNTSIVLKSKTGSVLAGSRRTTSTGSIMTWIRGLGPSG